MRTRAILERLRGAFTTRRYTNPRLPYLTSAFWLTLTTEPLPLPSCRPVENDKRQTVAELFVAEHGGDRIVADVVADAQSAKEQFDGEVFVDAVVNDDAVLLTRRQQQGDVTVWPV